MKPTEISRSTTATVLSLIVAIIAYGIFTLPNQPTTRDSRDDTTSSASPGAAAGANRLGEFSLIGPKKLEARYRECWRLARDHFVDTEKLVGFQSWEHRFDGAMFTEQELRRSIAVMLASLGDARTMLLTADDVASFDKELRGETQGSGLSLDESGVVKDVHPNSPAAKGGLQVGDTVLTVDGRALSDLHKAEAVEFIETRGCVVKFKRNPSGGPMGMALMAGKDAPPLEVNLVPAKYRTADLVTAKIDERLGKGLFIGYLRINNLRSSETVIETARWLKIFDEADVPIAILDLSELKGGDLACAAQVVALFLSNGQIVQSYRRDEGGPPYLSTYSVSGGKLHHARIPAAKEPALIELPEGRWYTKPLMVIIDENTEGTAELIAAAFKANGRAKLVGKTSAGKHCGQRIFTLRSGLVLQVTTCRNCTPDGKLLSVVGVAPDIPVSARKNLYYEAVRGVLELKGIPYRPHREDDN